MRLEQMGERATLQLRDARALRRREEAHPLLRPPTNGGPLDKSYGQTLEGHTGHFPRADSGLPDQLRYRANGSWFTGVAAALCALMLGALQVFFVIVPPQFVTTQLPQTLLLSALTVAACSPWIPIERAADPPMTTVMLSALTAAASRP